MSEHTCDCEPTWPPLTRPEVQTLALIGKGRSYEEVAEELEIALDTVKGRMKRIYRKLGATNAPHAVSIGIGMRLVFPQDPIVGGGR